MALMAISYRSLSIQPVAERVNALIEQSAPGGEIRGELRAWADANSVPI